MRVVNISMAAPFVKRGPRLRFRTTLVSCSAFCDYAFLSNSTPLATKLLNPLVTTS